ncbi:MAG: hypothetical protein QXY65_05160 [Candidatus Methanomethylicaceae archaeon]
MARVKANFKDVRVDIDPSYLSLKRYDENGEEIKEALEIEKEIVKKAIKVLKHKGIETDYESFLSGLMLAFDWSHNVPETVGEFLNQVNKEIKNLIL